MSESPRMSQSTSGLGADASGSLSRKSRFTVEIAKSAVKAHPAAPPPPNIGGQQSSFEPLLTPEQAAKILGGMHPKTLMRMARRGEVPAIKLGRYWYFRASSLNAWIEVSSTGPSVPCQRGLS